MNDINPSRQIKLLGLEKYLNELILLNNKNILPNKILLTGQKGLGKSTLAYHFINYVLSKNEKFAYNLKCYEINPNNTSYITLQNGSNPNLIKLDIQTEKKNIDIDQVRDLILKLNKSSLNNKPRFVLIDNIEYLNINSVNALLKILEEPNQDVYFILINNNKKKFSTLFSRCINFKIHLSHKESLIVANKLLDENFDETINNDLINYYSTPGNIYKLFIFAKNHDLELKNYDLKDFIYLIIENDYYKKDIFIKHLINDLVEFYIRKINNSFTSKIHDKFSYFIKKISNTKKFNLDEETLYLELKKEILNG